MRLWLKVLLSVVAIALLATGVYSLVRPKNATENARKALLE